MLSSTSQSRLVDASTNLAFANQSSHGSCRFSASVTSRLSGGRQPTFAGEFQYVFAGVFIAVVFFPTLFTGELAHVQQHLFMDVTTSRTPLTAWEEPIRNEKL